MPIAWHPKRWYNFCMLEDEKKETKPIFTSSGFNAYSLRVLGHFHTWRLDIVFLIWYLRHFVPKYILKKHLKQFSAQILDIV